MALHVYCVQFEYSKKLFSSGYYTFPCGLQMDLNGNLHVNFINMLHRYLPFKVKYIFILN